MQGFGQRNQTQDAKIQDLKRVGVAHQNVKGTTDLVGEGRPNRPWKANNTVYP